MKFSSQGHFKNLCVKKPIRVDIIRNKELFFLCRQGIMGGHSLKNNEINFVLTRVALKRVRTDKPVALGIRLQLEFNNVSFRHKKKTGVPGGKTLVERTRTSNKLNPHITPSLGIEQELHHIGQMRVLSPLRPLCSSQNSCAFCSGSPSGPDDFGISKVVLVAKTVIILTVKSVTISAYATTKLR